MAGKGKKSKKNPNKNSNVEGTANMVKNGSDSLSLPPSNDSSTNGRKNPLAVPATKVTTSVTYGETKSDSSGGIHLSDIIFFAFVVIGLIFGLLSAYHVRLYAIEEFGPVIHEFDPYFNYRATEVSSHLCGNESIWVISSRHGNEM